MIFPKRLSRTQKENFPEGSYGVLTQENARDHPEHQQLREV